LHSERQREFYLAVKLNLLKQLNHSEPRWEHLLTSPQWYLTIIPEIQNLIQNLRNEPTETQDACKARLYDFFERHLIKGDIALGSRFPGADTQRKPIDMVVVHHTSNPPGLRQERLSAIELIRLYGPYFIALESDDNHLKGQPISSEHVRNGKQVFWPYHWIVRGDGRVERLLYDAEIGWHAGNWDVNCRSVAIALDNDYEQHRPSDIELQAIARLIRTHYRHVPLTRIVGHREVNAKTACPSNLFLNGSHGPGWKKDLLELVVEGESTWCSAA